MRIWRIGMIASVQPVRPLTGGTVRNLRIAGQSGLSSAPVGNHVRSPWQPVHRTSHDHSATRIRIPGRNHVVFVRKTHTEP